MITFIIILFSIIILASIVRGIYLEFENASEFRMIHIWALIIVLAITIASVIKVNQKEKCIYSNKLEIPSMKIETIKNDSNIIKSDTTYIYKFKNNN